MIHFILHLLTFGSAFIILVEVIQILPAMEVILNKETFEKMYNVWIVVLVALVLMEFGFIVDLVFGNEIVHESLELLGMSIFLAVMVGTVRRSVIDAEIASGTKRRLEKEVEVKTEELRETVEELTNTKTAVLNVLEDLDESHKELQRAYEELKSL
ncbi:MAG: hypothetical protein ACE5PM_06695, partial [Candidatus Hydrothermarchaeales archaeon]